jgi:DNA-binding LacI/PurR family transcriptional regulator
MRRKVEKADLILPTPWPSSLDNGTKLIGWCPTIHNPIFVPLILFTCKLAGQGLRPLLMNLSDEQDALTVRRLKQYSVDGVIVVPTLPPGIPLAFRDAGVPVVNSFPGAFQPPDVHVVGNTI